MPNMKKTIKWPQVNKSQVELLHAKVTKLEKVEMLDLKVEMLKPYLKIDKNFSSLLMEKLGKFHKFSGHNCLIV